MRITIDLQTEKMLDMVLEQMKPGTTYNSIIQMGCLHIMAHILEKAATATGMTKEEFEAAMVDYKPSKEP